MPEALRPPRGLLFDYGGTLIREQRLDLTVGNARLLELASSNPRDVGLDELREAAAELRMELGAVLASPLYEFRTEWFQRLLFDRLGLGFEQSTAELDLEFWRAALLTRPQRHIGEALEAARSRRLPMGVVSNIASSAHVVEDDLTRLELMDHFRFVMASADYGVRKPHPALFLAAAGRLGLEPHDIWFMGDNLDKDVAGAQRVGMVGVWYNPSGLDPDGVTPDWSVGDWNAFAGLLAACP